MKRLSIIGFVLVALIFSKFWIGIYNHDEFGTNHLFIKHRAIWKSYFYSPRGMSDLKLSEMTQKQVQKQLLFNEFVYNLNLSK